MRYFSAILLLAARSSVALVPPSQSRKPSIRRALVARNDLPVPRPLTALAGSAPWSHGGDEWRDARRPWVAFARERVPGLALTGAIAVAAEAVAKRTAGLSPLLWASIFGIAVGTALRAVDPKGDALKAVEPGVRFSKARLLRAGIVLYGAKLTVQKIVGIGAAGLLADLYSVVSTLCLGLFIGRRLGLDEGLTVLIATGSAICGCSAVAAAQPIIDAESHHVAAAVGTVVLCGTAAMFVYPALQQAVPALKASPRLMGIYTGATVHELAGVVAAGNAMGPSVASVAVVTKLVRVTCLEPWLLALFYLGIGKKTTAGSAGVAAVTAAGVAGSGKKGGVAVPWFALGFAGVAALNSAVGFGPRTTALAGAASGACLSCAMAALGLDTDVAKVKALGAKPVVLSLALWANLLIGGGLVAAALTTRF